MNKLSNIVVTQAFNLCAHNVVYLNILRVRINKVKPNRGVKKETQHSCKQNKSLLLNDVSNFED